ncbi:hypothetical protein [Caballeronia glathei]|jgi:hypothetical protein|uniref:hypothetical protein n=1 Tax=Caballeronia glathei TaxID=60547 RepID=UPI00101A8B0A|nr:MULTISPECIES: hypothetical protein [Burkholderiaceae]
MLLTAPSLAFKAGLIHCNEPSITKDPREMRYMTLRTTGNPDGMPIATMQLISASMAALNDSAFRGNQ